MINIKNAMFTTLKNEIKDICPNLGSVESDTPPNLPYIAFLQRDNAPFKGSADSGSKENHVQPMIQIDVYTSKTNDTMYHAETIADKADEIMQKYGWERIFGPQPIATNYFRVTMRYQGVVRKNGTNDYTVI